MTSISKLFITTVLDGVVFPSNVRKQTLLLKDYRPTKIFIVNLRQSAGEVTIQAYVRVFNAK